MWILKKFFGWLSAFFGSKAGKNTLKEMAGAGIIAGTAAAGEMAVAHKRNKRAEHIKAAALKKHDEVRAKVETTLADLGETKLEIYRSFGELTDAIQSIQRRPEYELSIEGIELPGFKPAEFKQLAKKIEADVESILTYYKELDKTAKRFHKTLLEVKGPYLKHLHKVQKIITRKTDWEQFWKAEKLAVKNAIALVQLLHRMCAVQLVLDAPKPDAIERVNTPVVDRMIADANNVCEKVKQGTTA